MTNPDVSEIVTADFRFEPYWWRAARPWAPTDAAPERSYDAVVIGSGFTGASAALHLARGGRSVAIVDRQAPGEGAARRNAGFIGRVLKKPYSKLAKSNGRDAAGRVYNALQAAYLETLDVIAAEEIECFAARPGRFVGATSEGHFKALEKDLGAMRTDLGFDFRMVSEEAQREAIGSAYYHGGAVIPDSGSLHPGLYHEGLLKGAVMAGAEVFGHTDVTRIDRKSNAHYLLQTSRGEIACRDVVVATNGYTTHLNWYRRRLVPFRAYMAATEELSPEVLEELVPGNRTIIDSNTNIDFFRRSPSSSRLLFGGATAAPLGGAEDVAVRMKSILDKVFPQAVGVRLDHVWDGYCAGTFDLMPHVGRYGGIYHAMGYNFSGITLGTVFGRIIAEAILTGKEGASEFYSGRFPTVPFYTGNPWFLGAVMKYFEFEDWKTGRKAG